MSRDNLLLFKLLAVGAGLLYVYKLKQSGASMGNIRVNPEKIAGLAAQLVEPKYRKGVARFGARAIERIMQ